MIKGGANALTVGLIGWFGGLLTAPFEGYLKGFAEFMFDFEFGIASAIFDYTIQSALYRNEENVGFFSINPYHGESIKRAELHLCI